jgi:hypothetical protein
MYRPALMDAARRKMLGRRIGSAATAAQRPLVVREVCGHGRAGRSVDRGRWRAGLVAVMGRLTLRFARVEPG